MRTLIAFLGSLLVFFGVACLVAEGLHVVVGDASGWLSLGRVWDGVHGASLESLRAGIEGTLGPAAWTPLSWLLTLPSWLVLLALGLPLAMLGRGGRERSGFG
ncbi:MAG: hypothetical protein ACOCYE_06530 [Pseudomonadota bacterium]